MLALLIFGGATLQDFAFALLVGITSGAYSSIFIAAPLLTIWKEREPEYARRKTLVGGDTRSSGRMLAEAEQAAADAPTPSTPMDVDRGRRAGRRRQPGSRREEGAAPPAPPIEAAWTPPVAAPRPSATRSSG